MVNANKRCVIISASPELESDFINTHVNEEDYVICADGGADKLISTNIKPNLIIGDFDSSKKYGYFINTEIVKLQPQKDDTDTMYCAREALKRGFQEILFLGATGGRIDHTLANLSVLLYLKSRGARGKIVDEFNEVTLLESGKNILKNLRGKTISVIPFACFTATLSYKGLFYPLENKAVNADYPYTISNVAVDDNVEIYLHSGMALLVTANE